jgi:hypothetical protein
MRACRKDNNQPAIEKELASVGAGFIDCTVAALGLDLIVMFRGQVYFCEVKNPAMPPSKRLLTPLEIKRKEQIEMKGLKYHVIETGEQVLRLIGAIR